MSHRGQKNAHKKQSHGNDQHMPPPSSAAFAAKPVNPTANAKSTSPETSPEASGRPAWWTENIETSWSNAKHEAISDWNKTVQGEKKLEQGLVEKAMGLGHGAREAFDRLHTWGTDLEEKLSADWKETGHEAEAAWEKVRDTVKHAWERAAKTAKSIPSLRH